MSCFPNRARLALLAAGGLFLLAGCAHGPDGPEPPEGEVARDSRDCRAQLGEKAELHLQLVRKLADQGRSRAVLAHLRALEKFRKGPLPAQALRLRADAHRRLGQWESAARDYRALRAGCMPGIGAHGLGLLEGNRGNLDAAIAHLRIAVDRRPVDPVIRNDLGYALLMKHKRNQARDHLQAALQLGGKKRAAANLVLLELAAGNETDARHAARLGGLGPQDLQRIRKQAQPLAGKAAPEPDPNPGAGGAATVPAWKAPWAR
jgi:Flp pilus assembly protein TadD